MQQFIEALAVIMTPTCLGFMIIGTAVGILFGAMPGLSATLAVAVFIPVTYAMEAEVAVPLLIALYIGGISGGLISAILINIPGTPSSVATTFDGAPLARKGEGAKALGVGVVFSFMGTLFSIIMLIFIAPFLAKLAFNFGPYEYFAVVTCSFLLVSGLSSGNMLKGLISATFGVFFSLIGMAPVDAVKRFTFGNTYMAAGLSSLPVLVGLFALSELLHYVREKDVGFSTMAVPKFRGFGFSVKEFFSQLVNFIRSAVIGLCIGILPGIGGATSNLIAYAAAKNSSKHPEKFGTGIIDGVVASESSNNAAIGGAMIPLLSLGIPGDAVTAILLGALTIKGLQPGPLFFRTNVRMAYVIFAAMIVASVLMLLVEFFGMRLFTKLLSIPRYILLPAVMVVCVVGAYSATQTVFSVWVLFVFGLIGFLFSEFKIPLAPCIIGFVLGGSCELYLRRGMQMSGGSIWPFFQSPIVIGASVIAVVFVGWKIFSAIRGKNAKKEIDLDA
ncbi:MAG: tripartite tricarboxylate transporter permease [Firmicutes bacterium]|nr:tripartite tricarboxylate transporter permease [Bacillota bacterium]